MASFHLVTLPSPRFIVSEVEMFAEGEKRRKKVEKVCLPLQNTSLELISIHIPWQEIMLYMHPLFRPLPQGQHHIME
jgi:hypothetical protein